jgi:SulP family sulfate permease
MNLVREVLSGVAVSLSLVPTSIAYALFMGMSPKVGTYASIVMVLTTAFFGSIPGLVSNATAAVAVAMAGLVEKMGPEYLFAGVILGGVFQMLFAFFNMGRYFEHVPPTVVSGFLLGLAALIAQGQLSSFKGESFAKKDEQELAMREKAQGQLDINSMIRDHKDTLLKMIGISDDKKWLDDAVLSTIALTSLGVAIMFGTHFAKIPMPPAVPGALLTVAIVTLSYYLLPWRLPVQTIGDKGKVGGELPKFRMPNIKLDFKSFLAVVPYSASMAVSTLTETMLMMKKAKEVLHVGGNSRQENFVMGVGNVLSGFTGGMGGNVCVGLSQLNLVGNKARTRVSTVTAGVSMLLIMLVFAEWVEAIPMPALIAIMVFVVFETGDWKAFHGKNTSETLVILLTAVTAFATHNLAAGVLSGTALHNVLRTVCRK